MNDFERQIWANQCGSAEIDGQSPDVNYEPEDLDSTPASRALIARIKARRDTV